MLDRSLRLFVTSVSYQNIDNAVCNAINKKISWHTGADG